MGHCMPAIVAMGRRNATFIRGDSVKHKARFKWRKKKGGRFQETHFQAASRRGGRGLLMQKRKGYHPPEAPRNTTSYIIHSKSMVEAMAPVVTPSPFTPAVLPTPGLSPLPRYKEQFAEEVKEWGVNGYGSMNGLIRMKARDKRRDGGLVEAEEEKEELEEGEEEENEGQYAQSVQQLEQRLDQGLSRFEMVYPCITDDDDDANEAPPLEVRLVDQEYHIAQLEEENITLRERLILIEQELGDLRSRMNMLEGYEPGEVVSEKSIGFGYPSESQAASCCNSGSLMASYI